MKNTILLLVTFLLTNLGFTQTQPTLRIHKTNGSTQDVLLSDIQSITFSTTVTTDFIVYSLKTSTGQNQIWRINSDGTNNTKISDITDPNLISISISPNKTLLAYSAGPDNNYNIYVMNIDGTNKQKITNPNNDFLYYYNPIWISNSQLFVSVARNGDVGKRDVIRINSDGSNVLWFTQSSTRSIESSNPSPTGNKICVAEGTPYAGATTEVYLYDYPSFTNRTFLSDPENPGAEGYIRWSSQNQIFFSVNKLYRINPDGTNLITISPPSGYEEFSPGPSPDGSKFVHIARNSTQHEIVVRSSDGSNRTVLITAPNPAVFTAVDWK